MLQKICLLCTHTHLERPTKPGIYGKNMLKICLLYTHTHLERPTKPGIYGTVMLSYTKLKLQTLNYEMYVLNGKAPTSIS